MSRDTTLITTPVETIRDQEQQPEVRENTKHTCSPPNGRGARENQCGMTQREHTVIPTRTGTRTVKEEVGDLPPQDRGENPTNRRHVPHPIGHPRAELTPGAPGSLIDALPMGNSSLGTATCDTTPSSIPKMAALEPLDRK